MAFRRCHGNPWHGFIRGKGWSNAPFDCIAALLKPWAALGPGRGWGIDEIIVSRRRWMFGEVLYIYIKGTSFAKRTNISFHWDKVVKCHFLLGIYYFKESYDMDLLLCGPTHFPISTSRMTVPLTCCGLECVLLVYCVSAVSGFVS